MPIYFYDKYFASSRAGCDAFCDLFYVISQNFDNSTIDVSADEVSFLGKSIVSQ